VSGERELERFKRKVLRDLRTIMLSGCDLTSMIPIHPDLALGVPKAPLPHYLAASPPRPPPTRDYPGTLDRIERHGDA
jgi:hypothetical protein